MCLYICIQNDHMRNRKNVYWVIYILLYLYMTAKYKTEINGKIKLNFSV